jgi:hypothetical protein
VKRKRGLQPNRIHKRTGPPYVERTPEQLSQLARDIAGNLVFTNRHIRQGEPPQMITQIFVPLLFMSELTRHRMLRYPPGLLYAYYSQALPRGVNGYPVFMEVGLLSPAQTTIILEKVDKIQDAIRAASE